MRTINDAAQFKKDYKRGAKGQYRSTLDEELLAVFASLRIDQPLPARYRDHTLVADYIGHRECQLRTDLLLIYMKPDKRASVLVRLGSHSELFR